VSIHDEELHEVYVAGYAASAGLPVSTIKITNREEAASLALAAWDAKRGQAPRRLGRFMRALACMLQTSLPAHVETLACANLHAQAWKDGRRALLDDLEKYLDDSPTYDEQRAWIAEQRRKGGAS
jgi:hypothetical protein